MAKNNKDLILEEGMKRFQQILEYTTINGLMDEADKPEDDAPDAGGDDMGGAMPPMDDPQGGMNGAPQGGGMDMGGADPNGAMPPMDGGMDMNGGAQTPEGFNPQDNMGDMSSDENTMQPDDEVIDITDLTDKQEETENEVIKINDKFDKVMKAIGRFEELVRTQNDNLENLRAEFEKRNPTQIEKLSMQSAKSYPFNVSPQSYWDEKEATSNYRTEDDDNGKEQGQYVITKKDLDGSVNWKEISDSLNNDDFMYNQTLNKVLGI